MRRVMSWIAVFGVLTGGLVLGTQVSTESRVEAAVNGGWSALGGGLNGRVFVTYQADNTAAISASNPLYVGGAFTDAGGDTAADYLAKWDGSTWSKVASTAFTARSGVFLNYVASIAKSGNDLYVGGVFAAGSSINIAKIDVTSGGTYGTVSATGTGMSGGTDDAVVEEIAVIGSNVYAGGAFGQAGSDANADGFAVWNGTSWAAVAGAFTGSELVNGMAATGSTLYVGGQFSGADAVGATPARASTAVISLSDTTSEWSAMSTTQRGFTRSSSPLTAAMLARSATEVYAAGRFTSTNDSTTGDRITLNGIAKWNGTAWSALGTGISGGNAVVETLAWSGATLWAGGDFTSAGGIDATNIAKWDGTSWDSITCGARNGVSGGAVRGIAPQSDGSIIVAGGFTNAGGNRFIAQFTPGADNCSTASSGSDEPVFIDFDGNGGSCTPSSLRADAVSAAAAFETVKCSFGNRTLRGFSTNPNGNPLITAGDSFTFTGSNRYFAIWGSAKPQEVTATPGVNSVTVSWKPPVSDGGPAIVSYFVVGKSATQTNYDRFCQVVPTVNQCKVDLRATNLAYTFGVRVIDQLGFGEIVEAAAVSPYDISNAVASRANVLFGLRGSEVKASGLALGLAGKALNAEYKIGSAKNWTTEANAAKVNAEGRFSWSKRFAASANKQNVTLRFSYGADAVSGTFVLARGAESGDLSAPLNVKVSNDVNRIVVTWDPPKFTGGEKIIGHSMCATRGFSLCRDTGPEGKATFIGLIPGEPYTITVAARTAKRTGPSAEVKRKILPTEALVRIASRDTRSLEVNVEGRGFPEDSRFRLEVAIVEPSQSRDSWRWRTVRSFTGKSPTGNRRFSQIVEVALDASSDGRPVAARLVTPNGIVYSKMVRALG